MLAKSIDRLPPPGRRAPLRAEVRWVHLGAAVLERPAETTAGVARAAAREVLATAPTDLSLADVGITGAAWLVVTVATSALSPRTPEWP